MDKAVQHVVSKVIMATASRLRIIMTVILI